MHNLQTFIEKYAIFSMALPNLNVALLVQWSYIQCWLPSSDGGRWFPAPPAINYPPAIKQHTRAWSV